MTAPAQVVATLGLNNESQLYADDAWLHAILTAMDGSGSDSFANPFTEVSYRLRNINPQALGRIKEMLAAGENRWAAGVR